jgi:chitin disaccharide deacetylase
MHLLIVNADDFGYTRGVNLGIIDAHQKGILTSTTIMANMDAFEHAVELAFAHPRLGIGVHLTLTSGRPLLAGGTSLVDADGNFCNLALYKQGKRAYPKDLYVEWKAQIDKVIDAGIKPSHLDSHHHVHRLQGHQEVICQLATEYRLPVRNNFALPASMPSTQLYIETIDAIAQQDEDAKTLFRAALIESLRQHNSVELGCHPGYIDSALHEKSSYTLIRAFVTRELQNPIYPTLFKQHDITLASYHNIV